MAEKLFDSELKVMDVLWREGEVPARRIVEELADSMGWKTSTTYTLITRCIAKGAIERIMGWKTSTTYTLITRCIAKGAIERIDPGYRCRALIPQNEVQAAETDDFIERIFNGSVDKLFSSLIKRKKISSEAFSRLSALIDQAEAEAGDTPNAASDPANQPPNQEATS